MPDSESTNGVHPQGESDKGKVEPSDVKRSKRRRRRRKPNSNKASVAPTSAPATSGSAAPDQPAPQAASQPQPQTGSHTKPNTKGNTKGNSGPRHPYVRGRPDQSRQKKGRWAHTYAALDLGTNNCRLLVAKPLEQGFKVIDAFSRTVRLGEGISGTGAMSQEAMDRSLEALRVCAQKMQRRHVTRAHCIATEACRTATNGMEFIAHAERETGLTFEIITTAQEARFAASGCAPLLDTACEKALVFDIGGGSTELVWLDLLPLREGKPEPEIIAWTSIPFGVVTLAEHYANNGRLPGSNDTELFQSMVDEVGTAVRAFAEAEPLREAFDRGAAHLIGNSGTVTTLAAVHLGLPRYDRSQVDGVWIDSAEIRELVNRLAEVGLEGRAEYPCIGEDRADLLLPGCAILEAIQDAWPAERMRVADRGLREGMLVALMAKADQEARKPRRRRRRGGRSGPQSSDKNDTKSRSGDASPAHPGSNQPGLD